MKRIFEQEARNHSDDLTREKGGDNGWVMPAIQFAPAVARAIAQVKDESLSEVMEIRLGRLSYTYLFLIPEKSRPGKATPFEQVESIARNYAILERELERLRKKAIVQEFPDPGTNSPEEKEGKKPASTGFAAVLQNLIPDASDKSNREKEIPQKDEKKERSPEWVLNKANEGSAEHIYVLGTYAERGLAPDNNGMEAAIGHYLAAAEKGEYRAMIRLAEIYRVGRGGERDEAKSKAWREKAAAAWEKRRADFSDKR